MDLVRHDIAIGNMIYGHASFITLRLDEQWDLAPGVGRPEIVAAHDRGDRKWVASGKAWYVLYHRNLGWAMELMLESRTLRHLTDTEELFEVNGHPAYIRRWERRRGIIRPKTITFIETAFNCNETDRQLRIELSGRCPPEGFQQVLDTLSNWWCH